MQDIHKLRTLYKLKSIYRFCSVDNRKESTAEHTYSSLMLADYFLTKFNFNLNRLKIYELLMYHDIVEIITDDIPLHLHINHTNKKEEEDKARKILKKELPYPLNNKFSNLFLEFEEGKTKESQFAKAIDKLDAIIHELDYKNDWKEYNEDFLKNKKLPFMKKFPELEKVFHDLIKHLREENYFSKI
jgi:putative hydrolases of HD superfamily